MPQNTAVGAVYNPKGIPYTVTAPQPQDWLMIQVDATGRVGKIRLSTLGLSLAAAGSEDTSTASSGVATLNAGEGVVKSDELTDATTYTLTLRNDHVSESSTVNFEVTENPDEGTPEIDDVIVGDGEVMVTVSMEPFTGTLAFNFTVS